MSSAPPPSPDSFSPHPAQSKYDEFLLGGMPWVAEVGKSLERSTDHIKQRIQFFDRLAVLSGAILAVSVPAFTSLLTPSRTITHRYTALGSVITGWILLFISILAAAVSHYLLTEFYALWTCEQETQVQSVLFKRMNLINKNMMRSAGGDVEKLIEVPPPKLSFHRLPWHNRLPKFISFSVWIATVGCVIGTLAILLFLVLSSY